MRLRILVGVLVLIVGLAVYAALVVQAVRWASGDTLIDLAIYAVAGILWLWPAARLTRWMNRAAPFRPPPGASP